MARIVCSVEDCDRTNIAARGYCRKHYLRFWRHGDPTVVLRVRDNGPPSCHPDRPYHAKGLCQPCYRALWEQENPERTREGNRRRVARFAEVNPERWNQIQRESDWKRRGILGMTEERYQEMLAAQDGKCLGCAAESSNALGYRLCVDHDHETGEVRGLLCGPCNVRDVLASDLQTV
jgi:hypothetical protein